jgi:hypothetical protein
LLQQQPPLAEGAGAPTRSLAKLGFALAQQPHDPNGVFSFKIALDFRAAP